MLIIKTQSGSLLLIAGRMFFKPEHNKDQSSQIRRWQSFVNSLVKTNSDQIVVQDTLVIYK